MRATKTLCRPEEGTCAGWALCIMLVHHIIHNQQHKELEQTSYKFPRDVIRHINLSWCEE